MATFAVDFEKKEKEIIIVVAPYISAYIRPICGYQSTDIPYFYVFIYLITIHSEYGSTRMYIWRSSVYPFRASYAKCRVLTPGGATCRI